jgi:hypothetical protein
VRCVSCLGSVRPVRGSAGVGCPAKGKISNGVRADDLVGYLVTNGAVMAAAKRRFKP